MTSYEKQEWGCGLWFCVPDFAFKCGKNFFKLIKKIEWGTYRKKKRIKTEK